MRDYTFISIFAFFFISFSICFATIPSFSRTDYALSAYSSILSINDINNDGISDIVSECRKGLISIYLGKGDGTFQKEKYFSPGVYMSFFLPGDYNKDGNIDFVTNGKILLGDGKNGFEIKNFDMGTGNFTYGASGDMNGDGFPDLVLGDHLNVLINNGDGTFHYEYSISPDKSAHLLNLDDYNKDGFPDLVIEYSGNEVSGINYIPSNNYKVFSDPIGIYGPYNSAEYAYFPAPKIDFNKDGVQDIYLSLERSGYNEIFLGNGTGFFIFSWEFIGTSFIGTVLEGYGGPNKYFIMDIDNDFFDDIVVLTDFVNSEPRKGCLSYYPGHGDGTFGKLSIIDPQLPRPFYTLASGDFNRDGLLDFVIGTLDSIETPGLSVFLSRRITNVFEKNQPEELFILNCFPNPFNSSVSISFRLNRENIIKIEIYDILGRRVKSFFNGKLKPGNHTLSWKGDDESYTSVSNGVYFCVLTNSKGVVLKVKKVMLMK